MLLTTNSNALMLLKTAVREILEYIGDDFDDCYTGVMVKSIHEDFNLSELLK